MPGLPYIIFIYHAVFALIKNFKRTELFRGKVSRGEGEERIRVEADSDVNDANRSYDNSKQQWSRLHI